ncbi:hypothetical protein [Caulobacter sp. S45]|uniref:DUF4870 family protein n=1 Tax=Caulobacter sp. S45 TaxID=1641861 RepID=UPI00131BDE92|nr:hypothetical protein [Caulobacter sp. S45]
MSDPIYNPSAALVGPEDKTMSVVVYVLYLLGFITGGLTAMIGVIMAYVLKGSAGQRALSHYVFQIRTFWIALIWLVVSAVLWWGGLLLTVVVIGFGIIFIAHCIQVVIAVWYAVRCVVGLIAALQDQPYGRPRAWIL